MKGLMSNKKNFFSTIGEMLNKYSILLRDKVPTFTSTPITAIKESDFYTYVVETTETYENQIIIASISKPEWLTLKLCGVVSTLSGTNRDLSNRLGGASQFNGPVGVAIDSLENVYVADRDNHRIQKITPDGITSTLAGCHQGFVDGVGTTAQFNSPVGVAVDTFDNIYVTDRENNCIRRISSEGEVSTLAGSSFGFTNDKGTKAQFRSPSGIAVDIWGNIYVADETNHKIRKITSDGEVSTLAGSSQGFSDGVGRIAQFNSPIGVAVDVLGNVYIADRDNHCIRKITSSGLVSTLAGSEIGGFADGIGTLAKFNAPNGVGVDRFGNVYVADLFNQKIRKITPSGLTSTLAGAKAGFADGIGADSKFSYPTGVAIDLFGNVYVADHGNHRIRKVVSSYLLYGRPANQIGTHVINLQAKNSKGEASTQAFTISVTLT